MYTTILFFILLAVAMFMVYRFNKLTLAGSLMGGVVATGIYAGFSYPGIYLLGTFFITGTWATAHGRKYKVEQRLENELSGKRDAWQVLANGGIGALIGIVTVVCGLDSNLGGLMLAGAFSAACADTLSSELGNRYGTKFINILTLHADERGKDGVISLEGTLAGMAGSLLIAWIYAFSAGKGYGILSWLVVAGTVGNVADSVLGATLERKGLIGNNMVNLLNTAVGAGMAGGLAWLFL